ncbi:ATP-binding protein [Pseudoduganella umbonata]|nr:ATP-binding protein [Pseudoduganella umbonata]MBB3219824.1 AAA+ superfamily predicted ATPase [Pseudoduganella umbonata]
MASGTDLRAPRGAWVMELADLPPELMPFAARLRHLDCVIEREILRLRARYQLSLDEFRGLYVSDEQVDRLVDGPVSDGSDGERVAGDRMDVLHIARLTRQARLLHATAAGIEDRLAMLAVRCSLSPVECDLVFLALAPELEPKYEILYAYLNDDVARKWPTLHLAQRLLDERAATANRVRQALSPAGTLLRERLVILGDAGNRLRGGGHQGFALAPPAVQFLLDLPPGSAILANCAVRGTAAQPSETVPVVEALAARLRRLPAVLAQPAPPLLVFAGEPGSGKGEAVHALASDIGLPVVTLDLAAIGADEAVATFDALALELKLWPALPRIVGADCLHDAEGHANTAAGPFLRWLRAWQRPAVLDIPRGFAWRRLLPELRGIEFDFDGGGYAHRSALWRTLPAEHGIALDGADAALLAGRFDFSAGQIGAALADAATLAQLEGDGVPVTFAHILRGARAGADQHLGALATKVVRGQGWDDLVLTPGTRGRVTEFTVAIRQRHVVFAEWGFGARLGHSGSLVALFAGASGTGKTMTAGVIAAELDIDLYKVDLSGLVSKYIGETEKNLDRVFDVARKANAMLFFDEADALFGKRSEVKDAHDRYANIETAYLLQKLEEHPGVVILATNVKRNIDEAFSRRLQYVIEFPLPEVRERERLWRGMFPAAAPVRDDVDFAFLARQFPLAGGHIRNVALDAAFLAAQADDAIDMRQIVQALARQYAKQGKIPSPGEFGPYYPLVAVREAR